MPEKKILIADYDLKSLETMANLFENQQLQIIKATDGRQAYQKFKEEKPDIVILEAMLPKLHGFDLTLKIFQETKGQVPVIIVTGVYKGPQYKNEALRSFGASDYFEKPIDENKLVETVINLLSEEEDIEEELPSPQSVIETIAKMAKKSSYQLKKEVSSVKKN